MIAWAIAGVILAAVAAWVSIAVYLGQKLVEAGIADAWVKP